MGRRKYTSGPYHAPNRLMNFEVGNVGSHWQKDYFLSLPIFISILVVVIDLGRHIVCNKKKVFTTNSTTNLIMPTNNN